MSPQVSAEHRRPISISPAYHTSYANITENKHHGLRTTQPQITTAHDSAPLKTHINTNP